MTKQTKETKDPLAAALDRIETAHRRVAPAKVAQNPVPAVQQRLSAMLTNAASAYQRERATFRELLPFLDRVLGFEAMPWSTLDGPQRRLRRAVRLATDIRSAIAQDAAAQLAQEIDDLSADHLRGGWEQYLESRIAGLAHNGTVIQQQWKELRSVVEQIAELDPTSLGEVKGLPLEIPLPERQTMAMTKE